MYVREFWAVLFVLGYWACWHHPYIESTNSLISKPKSSPGFTIPLTSSKVYLLILGIGSSCNLDMSSPVIFFILFIPTLAYSSEYVICVDGEHGHNNVSCLQPCEQLCGHPCQSLEYVQHNVKSVTNHSLVIEICNSGIYLTSALIFRDFIDLSIRGAESMDQTSINCSTSNSGLSFFNITGLSLSFLKLTNCGTKSYITEHPFNLTVMSALYILNCVNATINNSVLYMSNGTGIKVCDTFGQVAIENTDILESFVRSAGSSVVFGGSGLLIGFAHCTPSLISNSRIPDRGDSSNALYTIHNCNFSQNAVNASTYSSDSRYHPITSGGGAYVSFTSNTTNISVTFSNCTFQNNYALHFGGGMRVWFQDSVRNNKVSLNKTVFSSNNVSLMGGGLQISFDFIKEYEDDDLPNDNIVTITSSDFKDNTAPSGGGVSIFSTQIPLQSAVHFSNCTWTGNTALYGAAVHIIPGIWDSEKENRFPLFVFSNTNISSNKVIPRGCQAKEPHQSNMEQGLQTQINGAGAFFCTQINIVFAEETNFINNSGTALYLSGSIAVFKASSQVLFDGNSGTNGGAIALLGQSFLFPQSPSTFSFTNNTARQLGGGIYFQSTSQNVQQPCFIYHDYRRKNVNFTFIGNHAGSGRGHHIYASSFDSCNVYCNDTSIYDCIGDFTFHDPDVNETNSTASPPTQFSLNTTCPLKIFPGLPYTLPLIVKDLENNSVSNMSYEAVLENINSQINVDPAFKYVSNNTINIQGQPEGNAILRLDPSSTDISLLMEIVLVECPPGYVLNQKNGKCECGSLYYHGVLKCDPKPHIRYGTWMGRCNHTRSHFCTSPCPLGYCVYKNLYEHLPLNESYLEQTICSPRRTGFSCGSCKPNHSVYYNSWTFECGKEDKCHLGVLFYIVSTLIPLTIVFLVIVVFDTNIVNGWNGFLFFAQIVVFLPIRANGIIHFPTHLNSVLKSLYYVYGFFSLDFFDLQQLSFCLWKGATVMDILMVQLVSICFALSLVFMTVFVLKQHKLAKCFPCLLRRRYTVINGLSAFFILCYARCAWICFMILAPACIYDYNFKCLRTIAFYSGSLTYFKGIHIIYAVVAIIFFIFIVILPALLLLFYPLFFRFLGLCNLSESRAAMFLWRMMPIQLLDSFQNPFKNEHRCFAGLYFLYRAVALALRLFTDHLTELVFGLELEFIVIIVLHSAFHPYKKRVHNIIDLLLFFNLAFINWITTYNLETSSASLAGSGVVFWMTVQIFLLGLPLAFATIFIIINVLTSLSKALKENMYIPIQPKT